MCMCVSVCSQTVMGITNTNSEEILKMKRKKNQDGVAHSNRSTHRRRSEAGG